MTRAIRSLWKAKAFTIVAIATVALGVGANTAVFSVVDAVLLRPLPFGDADRIFTLTSSNPKRHAVDGPISFPAVEQLIARDRMFARLSAYTFDSFNLTGTGQPEQLPGLRVTSAFFDVVGVAMAAGPGFRVEDDAAGHDPVVVLARRFWARRFDMAPDAIGANLTLNGVPFTVVGALGVDLPPPFDDVDVWTTRVDAINGFTRQQIEGGLGYLWGIGRLPAGARVEQVQPEVDAILQAYARSHVGNTDADPEATVLLRPIRERTIGNTRSPLVILTVAVGLVLLIACANVANLLLVRATARAHEIAVRAALGASRLQLAKWLGAESVVLAFAGGALGTLFALWFVDLAAAMVRMLPRGSDVRINAPVMLFSLATSAAAGLVFGLAPALRTARRAPLDLLRATGRSASPHRGRVGGALIVAEVALCLFLLVGAGLLLKSFVNLVRGPVGFRADGLAAMRVSLPTVRYGDPASMRSFMTRVLPAIESVPGVAGTAASMALPPAATVFAPYLTADGPQLPIAERPFTAWSGVTTGFFRTLGIPLLAGRTFSDADDEKAPLVVVVSEALARRAWPGQSPIGRRILVGRFQGFAEVVGVVGDVKNNGLALPPQPQAYTPYAQRPWPSMNLVVRAAAGDPLALVNQVRAAVLSIDRDQPVTDVETMRAALSGSVATARFTATLLIAFAIAALLMAAAGVYGVIAYSVERRTREVGIRVALGADARSVLALVAGDGLRPVVMGMTIGVALAAVGSRALRSIVFDVTLADPLTYAGVLAVFAIAATAAMLVPARRALRIDPIVALRDE